MDIPENSTRPSGKTQKRAQKKFASFIKPKIQHSISILDLASGAAAPTAYFARKFPNANFTASDYSKECIDIAKYYIGKSGIENLSTRILDWLNLESSNEYDAVISLQTLSWLPEPKKPLEQIFKKLNPKWVAISSLFYEGDISCTIKVDQHRISNPLYYNIYSIKEIQRICEKNGYIISNIEEFEIDIDIPQPRDIDFMGTHTLKICSSDSEPEKFQRLQKSGPLLMPWYMLMIEKE